MIYLEDVYCLSGIPEHTFVVPKEYTKTKVALRTNGRGVIVEGPSGIGKTTCIKKVLEETGILARTLSARIPQDVETIRSISNKPDGAGVVIIDDFHLLPDDLKQSISNLLKVLADEARVDVKLILIGINRAGECLVQLAPDLNNRIDTIRFEKNPVEKIIELITKGEKVLNIDIKCKNDIANKSFGSFHVAQMLCQAICVAQDIAEQQNSLVEITIPIEQVISSQMADLSRVFAPTVRTFAAGNRNRRNGHGPYLMLLRWLSETENGALRMDDVCLRYPKYKASIGQISDKGYISRLIDKHKGIGDALYYDAVAKLLAVEDPKFIFYLKNIDWEEFGKEMGFNLAQGEEVYDFAVSFSGDKREYAEKLTNYLIENDCAVFYDKKEAAAILGRDLEAFFAPIYESDARFVIALIDRSYPEKYWTVFESERFKKKFGEDAVIPILFEDVTISPVDPLYKKGYERIDTRKAVDEEISRIGDLLIEKLNL